MFKQKLRYNLNQNVLDDCYAYITEKNTNKTDHIKLKTFFDKIGPIRVSKLSHDCHKTIEITFDDESEFTLQVEPEYLYFIYFRLRENKERFWAQLYFICEEISKDGEDIKYNFFCTRNDKEIIENIEFITPKNTTIPETILEPAMTDSLWANDELVEEATVQYWYDQFKQHTISGYVYNKLKKLI